MKITIIAGMGLEKEAIEVKCAVLPRIGENVSYVRSEGNYIGGEVYRIDHLLSNSDHVIYVYTK